MKIRDRSIIIALLVNITLLSLLLSACGGGGGGAPATRNGSTYPVNVTVSGLDSNSSGLVLQNNAADDLSIHADGTYAFNTEIEDGQAYSVTVVSQPASPNQVCTVSNPDGSIYGAAVSNITVTCDASIYSLGFNVTNLTGTGLEVANSAGENLNINSDGDYSFAQGLADGTSYTITVRQQPVNPDQICTVNNGSGRISGTNVSKATIDCVTIQADAYSIGGTVNGMIDDSFVIQNNSGDDLTISGNGRFTFTGALLSGDSYSVSIATSPVFNDCVIQDNSGTVTNQNIDNINIICTPKHYQVNVSVLALSGSGLVLQNNNTDDLSIPSNGSYSFSNTQPLGSAYSVTVLNQPGSPTQTCTVINASGVVNNAFSVDVQVVCNAVTYGVGVNVIGFNGTRMTLQNNGGDDLVYDASSGSLVFFNRELTEGEQYRVTVSEQPVASTPPVVCHVENGTGIMSNANVTDINVICQLQVMDIDAGFHATCALLSNQSLKCWGINAWGQLGQGDVEDRGDELSEMGDNLMPVDLGGETVIQIDIEMSPCAVLQSGFVKCWGDNTDGYLGLGLDTNIGDQANEMGVNLPHIDLGSRDVQGMPVQARVSQVAVDHKHYCALIITGEVKCWGHNQLGALGLGDAVGHGDDPYEMGNNLPTLDLGTGRTALQLSVSAKHSCALLDNSRIKCWGHNGFGQLGLGDTEHRGDNINQDEMGDFLPEIDLGNLFILGSPIPHSVDQVEAGHLFTCALLSNGDVKCWGNNTSGQLGQGDTVARGMAAGEMGDVLPAINLGQGRSAVQIAIGSYYGDDIRAHVCALLDNGSVKCWGDNTWGQLGQGDTEDRGDEPNEMGDNLPAVDLGRGRTALKITAGASHTCAILDSREVKCWGGHYYGALGLGDLRNSGTATIHRGDSQNEMGDNLPVVNIGAQ